VSMRAEMKALDAKIRTAGKRIRLTEGWQTGKTATVRLGPVRYRVEDDSGLCFFDDDADAVRAARSAIKAHYLGSGGAGYRLVRH